MRYEKKTIKICLYFKRIINKNNYFSVFTISKEDNILNVDTH